MQLKAIFAGVTVLAVMPLSAVAEGPLYEYADVAYVTRDPDVGSSLDGFSISGSYPIGDDFHVTGLYSRVSRTGLRFTDFGMAFGYSTQIAYRTDLVGRAGMVRGRVAPSEAPSGS
jgi:hypothetical protein